MSFSKYIDQMQLALNICLTADSIGRTAYDLKEVIGTITDDNATEILTDVSEGLKGFEKALKSLRQELA